MKRILLALLFAVLSLTTGCKIYTERFTCYTPDGTPKHAVTVKYYTFMQFGQAATLKTETQTEEFIRTVNGTGILTKPDAESIKAVTEGVIEGAAKAFGKP